MLVLNNWAGSPDSSFTVRSVDFPPITGSNPKSRRYPHRSSKESNDEQFDHLSVVRSRPGARGGRILRQRFPRQPCREGHASAIDFPGHKEGEELIVEFTVLGQSFIGLNGGPHFKPNESVSFMVLTENQEETDRYWDAIVGNGGQESACGWCKDRWGFSWQITPRVLLEATTDPDRAAAKRAMEAMMTMRKIDIATIEAARRGEGGGGSLPGDAAGPGDVRVLGKPLIREDLVGTIGREKGPKSFLLVSIGRLPDRQPCGVRIGSQRP